VRNDREQILAAIRKHPLASHARPDERGGTWIRYESPAEHFAEVLQSVGGTCQRVANAFEVARHVAELPTYVAAEQRCCDVSLPDTAMVAAELDWNVDLDAVDDPHRLAMLDFALLPGEFGVAENAAVWVTARHVHQRVSYFIAQHLAFVVPYDNMVHNMHEAYERLSFADNTFGCFVSGPSKTADIEQSLVIGAHGARSLTVFLVEDAASCGMA